MAREILVHKPDGSTQRIPLEGDRLRVGRSTHDNDLSFPEDASLSRWHLVLERDGEHWLVEDLRAKNPTTVNGARFAGKQKLNPGDRIVAGKVVVVFDPTRAETGGGDVVFVPAQEDEGRLKATVMTRLDGILSGEITKPGKKGDLTPTPVSRRLPLDHPAVAALVRACQELPGLRPLPELFELILTLSIEAVGAERGILMSLEGERLVPRAQRGEGFRISTTVRDKVLNDRTSFLVRDAQADEMFARQQSIVTQHIRTMMAVPLQTKDRVLGLIHVDSRSFAQEFTQDDLELLTVLANIAAIRVEQERLAQVEVAQKIMARDLETAARIQRRLLPDGAPSTEEFDLAGYNVPCRTVGGDYYDFFRYPDGRVAALLGDVSGKGMPAALLMTSLKGGVQVLAELPGDPSSLISRLNRVVCANFPPNRFVSLFFCMLDPGSPDVVFCNAGHNPPLLVRAAAPVERLKGGGSILGFDPEATFSARSFQFGVGDVLVLYSDGVTEAVNGADEEFGEDRLAEAVATRADSSAEEIVRAVTDSVTKWSEGAPAGDDITLVVARRLA